MILDILPLAGGTARLVRVYGGEPCVKLPGAVPAPEGEGQWPITELGDYCFSEKPRGLPGPEKICRYELAEDGKLCLTRAFGRDVSGKERYSFDFDAPAQDDELHPICGNFLEEVTLPDSLRVIGSCTFYNCRRLRRLTAGTGELTMGSDVFLNCFALEDLIIRATPEQATGLFALVGSITEAVRALFWPVGEAAPRAGLWYPAYWEDIEETPAHILLHTFSGQGYHYRQCFLENKLLPAEYDAIFPQGHDADDASVMAMLCFDRLRWPWQLSDAARDAYRDSQDQHRAGADPSAQGAGHRGHQSPAGAGCDGYGCLCRGCCPRGQGRQCRSCSPAGRRRAQKACRCAPKEEV